MHHVNYFCVNLGTAYMEQYISVTDIAHLLGWLCRIYKIIEDKKNCTYNYLLTVV